MNVENIIDIIKKSIINDTKFFRYNDMIIIGENTSGKSNILKESLRTLADKGVYFIDSTNRAIPNKLGIIGDEFGKFEIPKIIEERVKKDNFNRKDVFSYNSGGEVVLGELIKNASMYMQLFQETLDIHMTYEISSDFVEDEVEQIYINDTNLREISSGIQSMLRILMEIDFASQNQCKVVFIDEFNSNLDHKTSSDFFLRLRNRYPDIRFIITSHSIYTLRGVNNADVVKVYKDFESIKSNSCEFFDSNDLDNLEMIDRKLFGGTTERNPKDEKDILLSNTLKIFISGEKLSDQVEAEIKSISELTLRQKIVQNYILERIETQ